MYKQIMEAVYEMRAQYSHEADEALKRVGRYALENTIVLSNGSLAIAYHQARAKAVALDELLEKIANIPEDTGEVKRNPFCNDIIRDAQGNEIARAKGV